jgi:hypothetical protein
MTLNLDLSSAGYREPEPRQEDTFIPCKSLPRNFRRYMSTFDDHTQLQILHLHPNGWLAVGVDRHDLQVEHIRHKQIGYRSSYREGESHGSICAEVEDTGQGAIDTPRPK